MKKALDEPFRAGHGLAYVFGSGLLFIFISQIITGICLAHLLYAFGRDGAYQRGVYHQAGGGRRLPAKPSLLWFERDDHGARCCIFCRHFCMGPSRADVNCCGSPELRSPFWCSGMGFTGYLLPWDQKAYFATAVGTNIVGEIPLIGKLADAVYCGAATPLARWTLSRFYVAHVFLIPACIFLFIGAHVLLFRKAGPAGPVSEDPVEPKLATGTFLSAAGASRYGVLHC